MWQELCKRKQNDQTCLNVLLNSAEFSAKILQVFYSSYEIRFELLAKVTITCVAYYHTHACTHTLDFPKNEASNCLSIEYQLVRLSFQVELSDRDVSS
jgi:hypothetical protein